MRASFLKSYIILQSTLLSDRTNLIFSLPSSFQLDFSKTYLYSNFFQEDLIKNNNQCKNFFLIGTGAFLFSRTFNIEQLRILKNFLLNTDGVLPYLTIYKGFIFDTNRLEKVSAMTSFLTFPKELFSIQRKFIGNIFFLNTFNSLLNYCIRILHLIILRQSILFFYARKKISMA